MTRLGDKTEMMSTHCPNSPTSFMPRSSTMAQMTGSLPSPRKTRRRTEGERVRESDAGLIQQDAKSNPRALITTSIINQSKVCAGL